MPSDFDESRSAEEFRRSQAGQDLAQARQAKFSQITEEGVGNTVADKTGSPLLATLFTTAPAAAGSFAFRGVPKNAPEVKVDTDTVIEAIKKKSPKLAEDILPDKEIIESAQRLDIDLNPEHYSNNTGYREVIRSLKAKGGQQLQANEVKALDDIATKADELVENLGGSTDKSAVSDSILLETRGTIEGLSKQADVAYDAVRSRIPAATRVDTANIKQYLDEVLKELGGDKTQLATAEKKLFNLLNNKATEGSVTYAALDRVRKDIGSGFNKRSGPFKDDDSGLLRRVYSVLSDTQDNAANAFGVGDLYSRGRELVVKRKTLEDQAVALFGREANGSLVPQIRSASTGLIKGDAARFNKLMEALPESRRSEMASTVLGELFSSGSRTGGGLGTGFVKNFESLNRNKAAKNALFKHLPPEGRQRFNDIGRVLTGIVKSNAKSLANPSGTGSSVVQALESESFLSRLYNVGRKIVPAESVSTGVGLPGAGVAGVLGGLFSKQKIPAVTIADDFLTSPEFSRAIKVAIDGDTAKADQIIRGSSKFKRWVEVSGNTENLATASFIGWLTEDQ